MLSHHQSGLSPSRLNVIIGCCGSAVKGPYVVMQSVSRQRSLALLLVIFNTLIMAACRADDPRIPFDSLDFALADAGSGQKLFNQSNNEAPSCAACHSISGESSGIGNSLAGIAAVAAERVAKQSAEEYLYWSILRPGRHLVAGYSNIMYAGYEDSLEAADIADLIAYLQTFD